MCAMYCTHMVFYKKSFFVDQSVHSAPTLLMMFIGYTTGLPWLVFQTFVIEERHGFNKQVSIVMCY